MALPAVFHYFAPFFSTVWIIFIFIALLSPNGPYLRHLGGMTVTYRHGHGGRNRMDGPTMWMGSFHSCSRDRDEDSTLCTRFKFFKQYNITPISPLANYVLEPPPPVLKVIHFGSILLTPISGLICGLMSLRWRFPEMKPYAETLIKYGIAPWFVLVTFLSSSISFCFTYLHFIQTAHNFNVISNYHALPLLALPGDIFPMTLAAYMSSTVPFLFAMQDAYVTLKHEDNPPPPAAAPPSLTVEDA